MNDSLYIDEVTEPEYRVDGNKVLSKFTVVVGGTNEWFEDYVSRHRETLLDVTDYDVNELEVTFDVDRHVIKEEFERAVNDLLDKHDPVDAGANYRLSKRVLLWDHMSEIQFESEFELDEAQEAGMV